MVYIQDDLRIRHLQLTVERETVMLRKVEVRGWPRDGFISRGREAPILRFGLAQWPLINYYKV